MKNVLLTLFTLFIFSLTVFSQNDLKTIELLSPWSADNTHNAIAAKKSCFSFITEEYGCKNGDIYYGGMRLGNDWDWFQTLGIGSRNKFQNLGEKKWADDFNIPVVEPYAKLKDGEQRLIVIDSSGKDGEPGKKGDVGLPGRNADGTYSSRADKSNKNADQTVNQNSEKTKEKIKSGYQPYEKVFLGNIYVMRVVDKDNDFYVLFRVNELERGKRCLISWKKVAAPQESEF